MNFNGKIKEKNERERVKPQTYMINIFDTHAHYDYDWFDEDREDVLAGLKERGVNRVVNIGASVKGCMDTIELVNKYDFMYGAIGVHPTELDDISGDEAKGEELIRSMIKASDKIIAVGEIGLDYYHDDVDKETQKKWFIKQIDIARDVKLPIIIHSRDAAKDTVDIMRASKADEIGGVIHCYSYSKEMAKDFLDMDFFFGIGGVVTFENSKKLKEAVTYIPLEKIVLETDCPFLAPHPFRGKRNSSVYLTYVAEEIASLKGISVDEVYEITWENAMKLYRFS